MFKTYKIIVKNNKGEILYKTNEMSSSIIQYELDWLTKKIDLEGLTIIIKPIKGENERRDQFLKRISEKNGASKEVNLDDLDKFKI